MSDIAVPRDDLEVVEDSTTAENIHAWRELISSKEAKEFVTTAIKELAVLFGQTAEMKRLNVYTNILVMSVAFACIGLLGYHKLISEGTTGALAGMIVGYFFKKNN